MNGHDIIIADNHRLFRKGLVELISTMQETRKVWEASDGFSLVKLIKTRKPDVVVLDLKLPGLDGFEAAKIITEKYPEVKIIAISFYESEDFIKYLQDLGIHGYLLKDTPLDEMYKVIRRVLESDIREGELSKVS